MTSRLALADTIRAAAAAALSYYYLKEVGTS
jgi:hypothetical protein